MKKIMNKKYILGLVTGIILSGITVYAVTYEAKDVIYKNDVSVKDALDDLYKNRGTSELFTNLVSFSSSSNGNQLVSLENLNKGNYVCNHHLSISWVSGEANYSNNETLTVEHEINGCDNLEITKQVSKAQGANKNVRDLYSVTANRLIYFNCRLDKDGSISVNPKYTANDTIPVFSSLSCYKIN